MPRDKMVIKIDKDTLHHAYCLEGDVAFIKEELLKNLGKILSFKTEANPDFLHIEFDKFGIDDGRRISDFQIKKAVTGDRKIIVIGVKTITMEAQNSLLKTFEEPAPNTHFFLIIPSSEVLLPTLKSRLQIQKIIPKETKTSLGNKFLKGSKKEKLNIVREIVEEKDKGQAIKLLDEIEVLFYKKINIKNLKPDEILFIETINKFRSYLNDRSPSLKMLLEHLALITPK
ncbi:MAG TPA: hypothetical protein QGH03_00085 [Candidatus Paceibacterota bacterium]|nr:hypothetical protein [Candidatus Paceibacterota bacterium]HJN62624.1 hypothetical protein [Candidatus Paceibacterota bacterium]